MADYHPKSDCINSDLTSNLKQMKIQKASNCRSRSIISTISPHKSQFSAWIECFRDEEELTNGKTQCQIDAEIIQEKFEQIQKDRDERLKQFQLEVSNRVKDMAKKKHQDQLNKSIEEWQKESKVICQSASPKKIPTSRRNTCTFRASMSADKIRNIMTGEANVDSSHNSENFVKSVREIDEKVQMIRKQTHLARTGLVSKKVNLDVTSLPGGLWGKRDQPVINIHETARDERSIDFFPSRDNRVKGEILNDMWNGFDLEEETKPKSKPENAVDENIATRNREEKKKGEGQKKIRFKLPEDGCENLRYKDTHSRKPQSNDHFTKKQEKVSLKEISVPNENNHNYWTCRKLFMDIEREKVREALRRKKHKKHIEKLKQEKEIERLMIEKEVEVFNEYKNKNDTDNQKLQEEGIIDKANERVKIDEKQMKTKEINRYIDALKNLLKQKIAGKETRLPSICSCGNDVLDTHPNTCANNCIFYNNPKEYARVLTSVLSAVDA